MSTVRLPKIVKPSRKPLTPYSVTWLILGSSDSGVSESEREELVVSLKAQSPSLREGIELAENFISLIRQRQQEELDTWLTVAYNSILSPFHRFAKACLKITTRSKLL